MSGHKAKLSRARELYKELDGYIRTYLSGQRTTAPALCCQTGFHELHESVLFVYHVPSLDEFFRASEFC